MLQPVSVGTKSLADYTHLAGRPLIQEIRELAEPLEGLRVLHLSATAFGGGVAEILYTLIPLMTDDGLDAQWEVMLGREEFDNVTKRLHNALQGNPDSLSEEEWEIFDRYVVDDSTAQQMLRGAEESLAIERCFHGAVATAMGGLG